MMIGALPDTHQIGFFLHASSPLPDTATPSADARSTLPTALAAWSGGVPVLDASAVGEARVKATLHATDPAALLRQHFDCDPSEWLADFAAFRERWRLAGGSQAVRSWLDKRQRHWVRRSKRRRPWEPGATASIRGGSSR